VVPDQVVPRELSQRAPIFVFFGIERGAHEVELGLRGFERVRPRHAVRAGVLRLLFPKRKDVAVDGNEREPFLRDRESCFAPDLLHRGCEERCAGRDTASAQPPPVKRVNLSGEQVRGLVFAVDEEDVRTADDAGLEDEVVHRL